MVKRISASQIVRNLLLWSCSGKLGWPIVVGLGPAAASYKQQPDHYSKTVTHFH